MKKKLFVFILFFGVSYFTIGQNAYIQKVVNFNSEVKTRIQKSTYALLQYNTSVIGSPYNSKAAEQLNNLILNSTNDLIKLKSMPKLENDSDYVQQVFGLFELQQKELKELKALMSTANQSNWENKVIDFSVKNRNMGRKCNEIMSKLRVAQKKVIDKYNLKIAEDAEKQKMEALSKFNLFSDYLMQQNTVALRIVKIYNATIELLNKQDTANFLKAKTLMFKTLDSVAKGLYLVDKHADTVLKKAIHDFQLTVKNTYLVDFSKIIKAFKSGIKTNADVEAMNGLIDKFTKSFNNGYNQYVMAYSSTYIAEKKKIETY